MVSTKKLSAVMKLNGFNQKDMAKILGISPATFSRKLSTGHFDGPEIEMMLTFLDFDGFDPTEVFFTGWVAYKRKADRLIHKKKV